MWAWAKARERRNGFWWSVVVVGLAGLVVGSAPPYRSTQRQGSISYTDCLVWWRASPSLSWHHWRSPWLVLRMSSETACVSCSQTRLLRRTTEATTAEEIAHLKEADVGPDHFARLQRIAEAVRLSVTEGRLCDYADAGGGGNPDLPEYRTSLQNHCPELIEPLDTWDATFTQESRLTEDLRRRTRDAAAAAGMLDPPWRVALIIDSVGIGAAYRARIGFPGPPEVPPLPVENGHFWDSSGLPVRSAGEITTKRQADRVRQRFWGLLDDIENAPEIPALRQIGEDRITAGIRGEAALDVVLASDSLPKRDGCPLC